MKNTLLILLALLVPVCAVSQTAKTVSAYVDTVQPLSATYVVALWPIENGDVTFTSLSAWAIVPSQGCDTYIDVLDWNTGATSYHLFLGRNNGPSGSDQDVTFTIPNAHRAGIRAYPAPGQTCTQFAGKVNITLTYQQ